MEKPFIDRHVVFAGLMELRSQLNSLIEAAKGLWWKDREYEAKFRRYQHVSDDSGKSVTPAPREDGLIVPGAVADFSFHAEFLAKEAYFPGLPETRQMVSGIQYPFEIQRLEVHDEDAPHFVLEAFEIGNRHLWSHYNVSEPIKAAKFATSATPVIPINIYAAPRTGISLRVINITDEPRQFRAKLVGREQVEDEEKSE